MPDPVVAAVRERVSEAQVALLALLQRHPLDLDGDVALLSAAIGYIAAHHGVDYDTLAFRAASPRDDRNLH